MSWWDAREPRLVLAMDARTLSDCFTALCISVLYRGCAIPVARKVVQASEPGSWEPYWKDLVSRVAEPVPGE